MTDNIDDSTKLDFAKTEEEASLRFEKYKSLDPFPKIQPALLNSADIVDYVRVTGMIWPFRPDRMKSASYEIALLGKCVYWDNDGVKKAQRIEPGMEFVLKANSIAFVTVEPVFMLPDYMALRFNLKISHIYKGILLGTGPLVDPGYQGNLSIPLHNLTKNDYTFKGGDGIIWMEFTKLSPNDNWYRDQIRTDRLATYISFPAEKTKSTDVEDYLEKAVGREGRIQSSIPDSIQKAARSAEDAKISATNAATQVESIRSRIRTAAIITVIATVVALLIPLYIGFIHVYSLINDSHNYVTEARKQIDSLNRKLDEKTLSEQQIDSELDRLDSQLQDLKNRTGDERLRGDLERLRIQLQELKNKYKP